MHLFVFEFINWIILTTCKVDVSQFAGNDSNKAAKKIRYSLVKSRRYAVKLEGCFIFNDIKSDELINFYSTDNNAVDVAVTFEKKIITVCSRSTYIESIRKVIYALVQLLCVVKAYGIGECSLIGFTFPRLTEKTRLQFHILLMKNLNLSLQ